MSILDVHSGPGVIVSYLKDVKYLYPGIDTNPDYISRANKMYGAASVEFRCADVSTLGNKGYNKYDMIMMTGVLHHLNDATASDCLTHIADMLKSGVSFCSFDSVYIAGATTLENLC
ncbi:MAG: class I SAM-dependent methyltransferase [Spirochaetia bacterium]|nr:class I SAM-dependent methyltransferase [Spirochaetia bacterium]